MSLAEFFELADVAPPCEVETRGLVVLEKLRSVAPNAGKALKSVIQSGNLDGTVHYPRGYSFGNGKWNFPYDQSKYPQVSFWCAAAIETGTSVEDLFNHLAFRKEKTFTDLERLNSHHFTCWVRCEERDPFYRFIFNIPRGALPASNDKASKLYELVQRVFG